MVNNGGQKQKKLRSNAQLLRYMENRNMKGSFLPRLPLTVILFWLLSLNEANKAGHLQTVYFFQNKTQS